MAVYSDRIVLKTSIDSEASIIEQIEVGGNSEISSGEIVIGLTPGFAKLYTLDSIGNVVTLGGTTYATSLAGLSDVDVTTNPPDNLQSLAWDQASGYWVPSTPIVGATALDELTDVNLSANGFSNESLLQYNSFSGDWEATQEIGPLGMHRDVDLSTAPVGGQTLIYSSTQNKWIPGVPNIVGLAKLEDDPNPTLGGGLDVNDYEIANSSQVPGQGHIQFILQNPSAEIRFGHVTDNGLQRASLCWYDANETYRGSYFKLRPGLPDWENPVDPEPYGWTMTLPTNKGTSGFGLSTDGNGVTSWKDYRLSAEANPSLGADLDVGQHEITSNSFVTISSLDGYTLFKNIYDPEQEPEGGEGAAEIRLANSSDFYAGLTSSQEQSSSYTLALPEDNGEGKVGYALVADGSGGTYWAVGLAADLSATSINALADVDTVSDPPVNNDALVWDASQGLWVPGGVPAELSGNTLGQIGDVDESAQADNDVLVWNEAQSKWISQQRGIQDGRDYSLEHTQALTFSFTLGSADNPGEWESAGNTAIIVNNNDNAARNFQSYILSFTDSYPPTFSVSAFDEVGTWSTYALITVVNNGTGWTLSADSSISMPSGVLYLTLEPAPIALPLEDGKVLTYSAAQDKFVPADSQSGTLDYNELENKPDIPSVINDLDDVNTATLAPLSGQVLEWSGTSWVPGDGSSISAVTSVNEKTGRVFLNMEDLLNFGEQGEPGRSFSYNTNINDSGADYENEGVWGSAGAGSDLLISTTAVGGEDLTSIIEALPATGNLWIYSSSTESWNGPATYTEIEFDYQNSGAVRFAGVGSIFTSATGVQIKVAIVDPTSTTQPKIDGDIVTWNEDTFRYEPTTITKVSGGTYGSG